MEGKPAPDFRLRDGSGKEYALEDFAGSWLALFFYSKDNTSG
jgi:peroxiredoxin Q/BCP